MAYQASHNPHTADPPGNSHSLRRLPILVLRTETDPSYEVVNTIPKRILATRPARRMSRGALVRGDRILLVHQTLTGMWGIPGGGMEDGEEPEDALRREMAEETGVVVGTATHAVTIWEEFHDGTYEMHGFLCDGKATAAPLMTEKERYTGQHPEWVPIRFAMGEFEHGLPKDAEGWRCEDGSWRDDLLPVSEFLSHAAGIYAREAAMLRVLIDTGLVSCS